MSRFTYSEKECRADRAAIASKAHAKKVAEWLAANPDVGVLNGGKYYKVVDNSIVTVNELEG